MQAVSEAPGPQRLRGGSCIVLGACRCAGRAACGAVLAAPPALTAAFAPSLPTPAGDTEYGLCYWCQPPYLECGAACEAKYPDPGPQPVQPEVFDNAEQAEAYVAAAQAWAQKATDRAFKAACDATCTCMKSSCRSYQNADHNRDFQPWTAYAAACCTVAGPPACKVN